MLDTSRYRGQPMNLNSADARHARSCHRIVAAVLAVGLALPLAACGGSEKQFGAASLGSKSFIPTQSASVACDTDAALIQSAVASYEVANTGAVPPSLDSLIGSGLTTIPSSSHFTLSLGGTRGDTVMVDAHDGKGPQPFSQAACSSVKY